jgi:CheY-like chemotaxis protein
MGSDVEETVEDHFAADGKGDPVDAPGRRILVVDDNEDAAELLALALAQLGHSTRTANDGPSALQAAEEFVPDVALLDIGLPVMDGYELARQLRHIPKLKHVRLVAVTGYGEAADRRLSQEAGFDAYVLKPVSMQELESVL